MFLFRLASELGTTVANLERRMSSTELTEWIAFRSLEPSTNQRLERVEVMLAQLTACFVNAHRPKGRAPAKVEEFLLPTAAGEPEEARPLTPAEMRAKLAQQFQPQGDTVIRSRR